MTDLEITRLCAEAMGYKGESLTSKWGGLPIFASEIGPYNPLHDDAQAMALMKKLTLQIFHMGGWWFCLPERNRDGCGNADLNRAIVECVAKMQAAKK